MYHNGTKETVVPLRPRCDPAVVKVLILSSFCFPFVFFSHWHGLQSLHQQQKEKKTKRSTSLNMIGGVLAFSSIFILKFFICFFPNIRGSISFTSFGSTVSFHIFFYPWSCISFFSFGPVTVFFCFVFLMISSTRGLVFFFLFVFFLFFNMWSRISFFKFCSFLFQHVILSFFLFLRSYCFFHLLFLHVVLYFFLFLRFCYCLSVVFF